MSAYSPTSQAILQELYAKEAQRQAEQAANPNANSNSQAPTPEQPAQPVQDDRIFGEMTTPILIGVGIAGLATAAKFGLRAFNRMPGGTGGSAFNKKFYKGGFDPRMNKREAALILGLKETGITKQKLKEAHRKVMLANHPDRGGSPYLATKINAAKDFLEKSGLPR
ncbi:mitochondrial import inner membrane translocase subunit TIM14 [Saitoella coloradoensis]